MRKIKYTHSAEDAIGERVFGLRSFVHYELLWWKNRRRTLEMSVITVKQLLEAGVHFGHHTRRWNPKMSEYIFTERNGIYIIDLQKTVKKFEEAYHKGCFF